MNFRARAVSALRQIERSAGANIWDAHRGCAAIAGTLLIERRLIAGDAVPLVADLINRQLADEGGAGLATESAEALPLIPFVRETLAELAVDADHPRELAHDVIYSAYVVRALEQHAIAPWPGLRDALRRLVQNIKSSGPGWITVNRRNEVRPLPDCDERPEQLNYWNIFSTFDRSRTMEAGDMQLGHLLTHGHALSLVTARVSPAQRGALNGGFRRRVRALDLANRDQSEHTPWLPRTLDPRTAAYWRLTERFDDMHGHALKYALSFLELCPNPNAADLVAFSRIVWPEREG